jgi:hypothetical protein
LLRKTHGLPLELWNYSRVNPGVALRLSFQKFRYLVLLLELSNL